MTAPDTLPPELAELGELLREEPPRPDPTWARTLDSRAAAGFPRPPRRSPWAALKARRGVLIPVVSFACVALLVVGLSTANLGGDDGGAGSSGAGGGAFSSRDAGSASSGEQATQDSAGAAGAREESKPRDTAASTPPVAPPPGGRCRSSRPAQRVLAGSADHC
jgi:hypothetical protein